DVGVGRGHAWLNEPANIVLEENVERYAEELDILLEAWTGERFSYEGKYYTVKDVQVVPRPLQRPHPPIYQAGTSAKWFQRAVDKGYGSALGGPAPTVVFLEPVQLYQSMCAEAGTEPRLTWIKAIYLDDDEGKALEQAREPMLNFISFNVSPMDSLARSTDAEKQRLIDAGYGFYAADDFPNTRNLSFEQLLEYDIVYAGTPEKVGKQLLDLWHQVHYTELLIISHFGGTQRWQSLKT